MEFQEVIDITNKKFGKPCLVHAVKDINTLKLILSDKIIKIPISKIDKSPMEPFLNINKTIFLSLGFQYNLLWHGYPYSFIFDINLVNSNKLIIYSDYIILGAYKLIIEYWNKYDQRYLNEIKNKNIKIKKFVEDYFKIGKFDFWKIEKDLFNVFINYPNKEKLINLIKKYALSKKITFKNHFCKSHFYHPRTEIVSYEPIMIDSSSLIGFYVQPGKEKQFFSILNKVKFENVDINNLFIFNGNSKPILIKDL